MWHTTYQPHQRQNQQNRSPTDQDNCRLSKQEHCSAPTARREAFRRHQHGVDSGSLAVSPSERGYYIQEHPISPDSQRHLPVEGLELVEAQYEQGDGVSVASLSSSSSSCSSSASLDRGDDISASTVLARIEDLMIESVIEPLDRNEPPHIGAKSFFHSTHCRSLTSILMVASFCYDLLKANRTTTTREVYYFFVTHFRHQAECDKAIWDLSALLRVPRSAMGLAASPKGWFCGCLNLYNSRGNLIVNGRELDSHGMAITSSTHKFAKITSDAKCILVIEKEGVYNRLSEDKFFLTYYPCILVTGKGFPDVATRQWVQQLQRTLDLPTYGLCDCNPYGISVLNTYHYGEVTTNKREPRDMSCLELQWIGLRPSQLEALKLPATVFQQLTPLDEKRLASLQQETHPFHQQGWNPAQRMEELQLMDRKVELEALNWKGMDFLSQWVHSILVKQDQADAAGAEEADYII